MSDWDKAALVTRLRKDKESKKVDMTDPEYQQAAAEVEEALKKVENGDV